MINGAAALAELIRPAGGADEFGVHRVLPVLPELSGLLPSRGLRRGSTVAVATGRSALGSGGTSLLLALLAAASRSGSWCAVVGVPALGVLAAAESGIVLERLALVPNPGPEWPTVVAALIDGVDVVVTAVPGPVSASIASRLVARARQRGSVLMPFGRWDGADVTLQVMHGRWEGLGAGRGRLRRREVTITARGRGAAARPREITMWMPGIITSRPTDPAPGMPSPARQESPALPGPESTALPGRGSTTLPGLRSTASAPAGSQRSSATPSSAAGPFGTAPSVGVSSGRRSRGGSVETFGPGAVSSVGVPFGPPSSGAVSSEAVRSEASALPPGRAAAARHRRTALFSVRSA
jgi:hypothetical protein